MPRPLLVFAEARYLPEDESITSLGHLVPFAGLLIMIS
jgi:hypothetical protein